jgi:hypothetical protein
MTLCISIAFPVPNATVGSGFCASGTYEGSSTRPDISCMFQGGTKAARVSSPSPTGQGTWDCAFTLLTTASGLTFTAEILDPNGTPLAKAQTKMITVNATLPQVNCPATPP